MKDKLKAIREACIKANPEIVELKFGCRVNMLSDQSWVQCTVVSRTTHKVRLMDSENDVEEWLFVEDIDQVIGRPIRLADVLLAMEENINKSIDGTTPENFSMGSQMFHTQRKVYFERMLDQWQLFKDNLEDQSLQCIDFVFNLIKQ